MGDRVAVFAVGGRLAQFGTPAQLLAHPADEFVEDFVGATRGLRRLTVTAHRPQPPRTPSTASRAGDLGSAIEADATLEEALAAMYPRRQGGRRHKEGAQFLGVLTPAGIHRQLRESPSRSDQRLSRASSGVVPDRS